ncbi:MAG: ParB N-terminal domain-containing protein [Pseudomonadota bacterium]
MTYNTISIPVGLVDINDHTFVITTPVPGISLLESIRTFGLINPPLVKKRSDGQYQILCGIKRMACCKMLEQKKVGVQTVPKDYADIDCLRLSVLDNLSHRPLNVIEQSRGIERLSSILPDESLFEEGCNLLCVPKNRKVFDKTRGLCALPAIIQEAVEQERLSFEGSVALYPFDQEDRLAFFNAMQQLSLSQNKECEFIRLVNEIARREGITISQTLSDKPLKEIILANEKLNRAEKTRAAREYLKRRRFPVMARMENQFGENVKKLSLGERVRIDHPLGFEGGDYSISFSFKDIDELRHILKKIQTTAENRKAQEIFSDRIPF